MTISEEFILLLLKDDTGFVAPELFERVTDEADALFANGNPTAANMDLPAIDVTHRFVLKTCVCIP